MRRNYLRIGDVVQLNVLTGGEHAGGVYGYVKVMIYCMAYWLLKTEPDCYNWPELVKDKTTVWDGVSNALALKHIRTMKKGDLALIYHTGNEKQALGIAQITKDPYPDPKEEDEKLVVVDLKAKGALKQPVTLSDFKADKTFAGWDLLRISRLSVVPVPEKMWERIIELSES